MKKLFLILLMLGIAGVFIIGNKVYQEGLVGERNLINCQNVDIGMSTEEVRSIMGAPEKIKQHLIGSGKTRREALRYYYKGIVGASVRVDVYFDPETRQVIRIDCDDSSLK